MFVYMYVQTRSQSPASDDESRKDLEIKGINVADLLSREMTRGSTIYTRFCAREEEVGCRSAYLSGL